MVYLIETTADPPEPGAVVKVTETGLELLTPLVFGAGDTVETAMEGSVESLTTLTELLDAPVAVQLPTIAATTYR